jgi:hypothetical protein
MGTTSQPLLVADRTGRRSKCTDETIARLVEGVALNLPRYQAALYAGVHPRTVELWLQRAASGHGGVFQRFAVALREAEGKRAATIMASIAKAGSDPKHWRAKAWLAERLGIVDGPMPTDRTSADERADTAAAVPVTVSGDVVDAADLASDELEMVRRRAASLRRSIAQAEATGSSQAVAALRRQLTAAEDRSMLLSRSSNRENDPGGLDEAAFSVELEAHADVMPEAHLAVFARAWLARHRMIAAPDPHAHRRLGAEGFEDTEADDDGEDNA